MSSLLPEDAPQFIVDQMKALGTTSNAVTIASTLRGYLRYRVNCGDAGSRCWPSSHRLRTGAWRRRLEA